MELPIQEASNLNLAASAMLLIMAYLVWSLPRRFAVCPLLVMVALMPMGQNVVISGLHFHLFRILLLVGVARVVVKGEACQMTWTRIDSWFGWWIVVSVLFGTMSKPSVALFVNRLGDAYNAVGCYYFVRCVVVNFEDIVIGVGTLALISLPVAGLMLVEKTTGHNLLSVFGGVPELTMVREGHLRCQGAFRHPILAGTFGATQLPLFVGLWYYRPKWRPLASGAILSSVIIVYTASSSGALLALIAGIGGLFVWRWRSKMRLFRWGTVAITIGLAVVMNAPVWYIFAKLSNIAGGTGWHRAWLMDQTVAHLNEWWLFGTTYTAHWGPSGEVIAADPDMMDITNHYVMEGVKGGLLKLGLFLIIIIACFKGIGRGIRGEWADQATSFFLWTMGVALVTHCLSFFSIVYFDQTIIAWFWLVGSITCVMCLTDATDKFEKPEDHLPSRRAYPVVGLEAQ